MRWRSKFSGALILGQDRADGVDGTFGQGCVRIATCHSHVVLFSPYKASQSATATLHSVLKDIFPNHDCIMFAVAKLCTCRSLFFLTSHMPLLYRTLSWQVHPPTAFCFEKHLLFLLPSNNCLSTDDRHAILEFARFLTELSVIDYFFVPYKPSVVAFGALLNAMDDIPPARAFKADFCASVKASSPLDPTSDNVNECCKRLRLLYVQGGYAANGLVDPRSDNNSPVCVSYGCEPNNAFSNESHASCPDTPH